MLVIVAMQARPLHSSDPIRRRVIFNYHYTCNILIEKANALFFFFCKFYYLFFLICVAVNLISDWLNLLYCANFGFIMISLALIKIKFYKSLWLF